MIVVALIAQQVNAAVRIDAGAIQPAVAVEVGIHLRPVRVGGGSLECLHGVSAAELIAIQHRRAIAIEHGQIESLAVGNHAQLSGAGDRAFHEREIARSDPPIRPLPDSAIAPAARPAGSGRDRNRDRSRSRRPYRSAAAGRCACCRTNLPPVLRYSTGPAAVSTQRSIRPSLSKSPGATSITPVSPSRPVPAAGCCPLAEQTDSL